MTITNPFFSVKIVDITTTVTYKKKYKYDIPVLHLNGELLCKHSLNQDRLLQKLQLHSDTNTNVADTDQ